MTMMSGWKKVRNPKVIKSPLKNPRKVKNINTSRLARRKNVNRPNTRKNIKEVRPVRHQVIIRQIDYEIVLYCDIVFIT